MTTITIDETKRGAKTLISYLKTFSFVEFKKEPIPNFYLTCDDLLDELAIERQKPEQDRLTEILNELSITVNSCS